MFIMVSRSSRQQECDAVSVVRKQKGMSVDALFSVGQTKTSTHEMVSCTFRHVLSPQLTQFISSFTDRP